MTRASLAILELDFQTAFAYHPMSVICVPLAALLAARGAHTYLSGRPPAWGRRLDEMLQRVGVISRQELVWGALGVLLVGLWLARALGALGGPVEIAPLHEGALF